MKLPAFDDLVLLAVVADYIHAPSDPIDTIVSYLLNEPAWEYNKRIHIKINSLDK